MASPDWPIGIQSTLRKLAFFAVLFVTMGVATGCAYYPDNVSTSTEFDSASASAIVVMGTNVAWYDGYLGRGRGLATHWQEFDADRMRLVPEGGAFASERDATIWSGSDYREPMVEILSVEPGSYALTASTILSTATAFVDLSSSGDQQKWSWSEGPTGRIAPDAAVDETRNFLFSVKSGQIVYIGHFEFQKRNDSSDAIAKINYSHDEAAARVALKQYPGISGEMITLDLALPPETAAR